MRDWVERRLQEIGWKKVERVAGVSGKRARYKRGVRQRGE